MNSILQDKKTLLAEIALLIGVIAGCYFGYSYFFNDTQAPAPTEVNPSLLGKNFVLFLNAQKSGSVDFKDQQFLRSAYVSHLQDYSEVIPLTPKRGRLNPFVPYASTRPIR